jgi:hypothetical protein
VRQSPTATSSPPSAGAITGAVSDTADNVPNVAAAARPLKVSFTTARPTATAAPAASPCTARSPTSSHPAVAIAHNADIR